VSVRISLSAGAFCLERAFGGYVTARGKGLGVDFVPHLVPNRDFASFLSPTTLVNSHNKKNATAIRTLSIGQ
jgi:hypothetical protein